MENLTELKSRLFDAYLHLPEAPDWHDFQGLIAAALHCEMDPSLPQILFKGTPDLALLELNRHIDKKIFESFDQNLLESMKTHEKVQATLEKKIRFFSDHLPKTLSILKYGRHPFRASLLLRMQGETVTSIWYFAGDTASDFNYYSKRFLLGSIYRATFIYWLKNRHSPIEKTLNFMKNRFKDVARLPKIKTLFASYFKKCTPFSSQ